MNFKIDMNSITKNISAIKEKEKLINKKAFEIVNDITSLVEKDSKKTIQKVVSEYSTGALARSVQSDVKKGKSEIQGEVTIGKEYSNYVEFGTGERGKDTNENTDIPVTYTMGYKGQKAKPYFYPTVKKVNKEGKAIFNKKMKGIN